MSIIKQEKSAKIESTSVTFTFYLFHMIFFLAQNIVENNRAEKSKMQDEKDQQTLLIDR